VGRLTFDSQQPASRGRLRVDAHCATSEQILNRKRPAPARIAANPSPPNQPETRVYSSSGAGTPPCGALASPFREPTSLVCERDVLLQLVQADHVVIAQLGARSVSRQKRRVCSPRRGPSDLQPAKPLTLGGRAAMSALAKSEAAGPVLKSELEHLDHNSVGSP